MDTLDLERELMVEGMAMALTKALECYHTSLVSKKFADDGVVMRSVASVLDIADYMLPLYKRAEIESEAMVCFKCKYYGQEECESCIRKKSFLTDKFEQKEGEYTNEQESDV